ncbi:MAG TPA: bacterial transcriptional activator domain-containing protein [Candidatus Elarobacter sp.]|jgi:DNA-binding SARP family transcriptional activator|nr:bacterial transcriptional activator domain-containing protein [Candidatus Elarobacter sp.]
MNELSLHFRFLGTFAIGSDTRWHRGPAAKKGRDLLQYLGAYPRRVATGDELAEAFWPGENADAVAHRIHLAASGARTYLRDMLDGADAIDCVAGGYAWAPNVRVFSDADEFLQLCTHRDTVALQLAADLYGGEFLAGEIADWLQPMRIRCASAFGCAIDRLAEDALAAGDHPKALAYGLQLVAAEPGHEGATCLVMRTFAALGQRARALGCFAALSAYLERHLGIGPSAQTTALAREIRGEIGEAPERAARAAPVG